MTLSRDDVKTMDIVVDEGGRRWRIIGFVDLPSPILEPVDGDPLSGPRCFTPAFQSPIWAGMRKEET